MERKKLYRSQKDKVLAGICGGLADYLNIDSNIIRIGFLIFGLSGVGVLVYIVALALVPVEYDIK